MSRKEAAKALLEDPLSCSSVVYMSALVLFGADLQVFEYETLRLECQRMEIDVADQNWEELFAALALRGDGRFMYDAATFENTIVAFNGGTPSKRQLQPTVPGHIAWAVSEASNIVSDLVKDGIEDYLDYEPVGYTAVMCKSVGMICVPPCLEFCEERLEELTPGRQVLCDEVKKAWGSQQDPNASRPELREDPVGVQLALMHSVQEYVQEQEFRQRRQLSRLF